MFVIIHHHRKEALGGKRVVNTLLPTPKRRKRVSHAMPNATYIYTLHKKKDDVGLFEGEGIVACIFTRLLAPVLR